MHLQYQRVSDPVKCSARYGYNSNVGTAIIFLNISSVLCVLFGNILVTLVGQIFGKFILRQFENKYSAY